MYLNVLTLYCINLQNVHCTQLYITVHAAASLVFGGLSEVGRRFSIVARCWFGVVGRRLVAHSGRVDRVGGFGSRGVVPLSMNLVSGQGHNT